ncbi:MAG TPA: KH domain-containing protein [Halobacteria archaeon]|nr:KH domain-containing protein [Halobacteria archaeon]
MSKDIVIPGYLLGENINGGDGTFRDGNKVYSAIYGVAKRVNNKVEVISLKGKYNPKKGDLLIGIVTEITFSMWILDINSPYDGFLYLSDYFKKIEKEDMSKELRIGETVVAKVKEIETPMRVNLTLNDNRCKVIRTGVVVDVPYAKIPVIIGKGGSTINLIKKETNCDIFVAQNGRVWINGSDEMIKLVINIIKTIEKEECSDNISEKITKLIQKEKKR